ncbi:MAG: YfiR family protein [Nevskia sp.]|nr:YfiR family protein [Nevskia sp.]
MTSHSAGRVRGRAAPSALLRLAAALVLLLVGADGACAEIGSASEAAVKMAFVYNFGKFVEWPPPALATSQPFVLCTAGDTEQFKSSLAAIEGKTAQGHEVKVHALDGNAELAGCQTLFIAQSEREHVRELLKAARNLPILTVSDIDEFADAGGVVELITRNGRVQFNINVRAAKAANLTISSELMKLAHSVVGAE